MLLADAKALFIILYLLFIAYSLARWMYLRRAFASTRYRLGALGMLIGSISAALFVWFRWYVWKHHALPFHGSNLWELLYLSEALAVTGMVFGAISHGWVRDATLFISFVMAFKWLEEMMSTTLTTNVIDNTLFTLLLLAITSRVCWHLLCKSRGASVR